MYNIHSLFNFVFAAAASASAAAFFFIESLCVFVLVFLLFLPLL